MVTYQRECKSSSLFALWQRIFFNSLSLYPLALVLDIIKVNYYRCRDSTSKSIFYALNFWGWLEQRFFSPFSSKTVSLLWFYFKKICGCFSGSQTHQVGLRIRIVRANRPRVWEALTSTGEHLFAQFTWKNPKLIGDFQVDGLLHRTTSVFHLFC